MVVLRFGWIVRLTFGASHQCLCSANRVSQLEWRIRTTLSRVGETRRDEPVVGSRKTTGTETIVITCRSASAALSAETSAPEKPSDVDQPRAGLFGRRNAENPLPALSRGEGQGRHRPDNDGGVGGRLARVAPRFRQSACLQGRDRALAARTCRGLP